MTTPVQFPLTLFIPLKAEAAPKIRELFKVSTAAGGALVSTGLVHFARLFVFEEGNPMGISPNIAAVITSYDGDFKAYVQAFVDNKEAGELFNVLLAAADIPGAADLIPVQKNSAAFADLVAEYDASNGGSAPWGEWFSAYPDATVPNILEALGDES